MTTDNANVHLSEFQAELLVETSNINWCRKCYPDRGDKTNDQTDLEEAMSESLGTVVGGPFENFADAYCACGDEQTIFEEARGANYWIVEVNDTD